MLPRPFVAPNVGGNGNRKGLLVGNGLMPLRGVPDAIKPFALEVSPKPTATAASEVTSTSGIGDQPGKSQNLTPFQVVRN